MRQRIVINLDAPKTEGGKPVRKRRRWPRVLGILGLLVLIVVGAAAVGGFLLWRQFQSSPTYALASILDAAQRNDVIALQKRIDNEEIAKNVTATVSQKATARYGSALNSSIQQQIDSAMPSLVPRVKQAVQDELFNAMKAFAAAPEQRSFISLVGVVRSLMKITQEGDSARVTGAVAGHNIEMSMRRGADGWKVIDVKDDLIVQRIVDGLMKDLPAISNIDWSRMLPKKSQRKAARRGR
jgi:DUF2939 family protein